MKFEQSPASENIPARALLVAEKVHAGQSYPEAVRQVLRNERVTHEPDVQRIMKELSPLMEQATEKVLAKQALEADMQETLDAEALQRKEQEFTDIVAERGGDPED